jgi:hypothetical protein
MTYNKNYNNKFAVKLPSANVDPYGYYKKAIIDKLIDKYPYLTMAGLDAPFYTPSGKPIRSVEYASAGDAITFGTAKSHDVNWVKNTNFMNGVVPTYDIQKDWTEVMSNIDAFAKARKPKQSYNPYTVHSSYCNCSSCNSSENYFYVGGKLVEVYDDFIKVGLTIIPRYTKPATFKYYSVYELETIHTIIITVRSLF